MIRADLRSIPDSTIHFILSSPRRRETLAFLSKSGSKTTVRELSEYVAVRETGENPPPRQVRETVYVSLIQTHLPALEEVGVIQYDHETKEVVPLERSRDLRVYMEVVTRFGITWDEYYRYLGVLALLVVLATQLSVPVVSAVDTLVWVTLFLVVFAASTAYQFKSLSTTVRGAVGRFRLP